MKELLHVHIVRRSEKERGGGTRGGSIDRSGGRKRARDAREEQMIQIDR